MLDTCLRRGARAAIVPTDEHDVGMPLRHASRNGTHADFRYQLDANARMVVGIFEIMDELRQVLDGIDIVVWRR
jgi:hypothetical protein